MIAAISNRSSPRADYEQCPRDAIHRDLKASLPAKRPFPPSRAAFGIAGIRSLNCAEHCNFDEVAYLLLYGELPKAKELEAFQKRIVAARELPAPLRQLFTQLPKNVVPMDALRTAVSILAHYDPEVEDNSPAANLRKAERLYAQIPLAVADQYSRSVNGRQPIAPRADLTSRRPTSCI